MDDRIISTAVLTLSRQQEEFLARYRTHEAQKAYFESYGLGVTPFFRGGGSSHGVIPPSPEPELPYDYEVEYLEVNENSGLVYIETDFNFTPQKYVITLKCTPLPTSGFNMIFLTSTIGASGSFFEIRSSGYNNNSIDLVYFDKNSFPVGSGFPSDSLNELEINSIKKIVYINSTASFFPSADNIPNNQDLILFSNILDRQKFFRFYNMSISNETGVLCHLIPVVKDGFGCVYDKVRDKLFTSKGVGTFTLGSKKI